MGVLLHRVVQLLVQCRLYALIHLFFYLVLQNFVLVLCSVVIEWFLRFPVDQLAGVTLLNVSLQ